MLLDALTDYGEYVLISSSAVYPDTCPQSFTEETPTGPNRYWGGYGFGKCEAEKALLQRSPRAYILHPPYLYGPMNNVYREAFAFDCAMQGGVSICRRMGKCRCNFLYRRFVPLHRRSFKK